MKLLLQRIDAIHFTPIRELGASICGNLNPRDLQQLAMLNFLDVSAASVVCVRTSSVPAKKMFPDVRAVRGVPVGNGFLRVEAGDGHR